MRKTLYKAFWAWDFEKEEKWLNEMAAKGFLLAHEDIANIFLTNA